MARSRADPRDPINSSMCARAVSGCPQPGQKMLRCPQRRDSCRQEGLSCPSHGQVASTSSHSAGTRGPKGDASCRPGSTSSALGKSLFVQILAGNPHDHQVSADGVKQLEAAHVTMVNQMDG